MNIKLALVISEFNKEITDLMERSAIARLEEIRLDNYKIVKVPGALELPIIAKKLAKTGTYDAIILLGAVIRGETDHYDYVCSQISYGSQKIALEEMVPIIFGVLTCDTEEQALDRIGGSQGNKPKEMGDIALYMGNLMKEIGSNG